MKAVSCLLIALAFALVVSEAWAEKNKAPGGYTADAPSLPDGQRIYFSLISLCDVAPPKVPDTPEVANLIPALHEDDWRQVEFAPNSNRAHVDRMVVALSDFKRKKSVGSSFSGIYIREEFPHPVSSSKLTLSALRKALPSGEFLPVLRISSGKSTGQVAGGFAIRMADLGWVYGHAKADSVQSLGLIVDQSPQKPSPESINELLELLRAKKLLLIDWYSLAVVPGSLLPWLDTWKQERDVVYQGDEVVH